LCITYAVLVIKLGFSIVAMASFRTHGALFGTLHLILVCIVTCNTVTIAFCDVSHFRQVVYLTCRNKTKWLHEFSTTIEKIAKCT